MKTTGVQPYLKIGEVARSNVNVGGLGDDSLERVQVAMNIAKDKHLHYFSPTCAGRVIFFMFRWKIPLDCQPSSITSPAESKTTR